MSNDNHVTCTGKVTNVQSGFIFVEVKIGDADHVVCCHPSGKLRKNSIMVIQGDTVDIRVSPYDFSKGIVTYRHR